LNKEGINNLKTGTKVVLSGDVMQDGALFYKRLQKPLYLDKYKGQVVSNDYVLCTIHRAENTDDPKRLRAIFEALNEIAKNQQVVLPLHPRTKKSIQSLQINTQNLTIIDPVGYLNMVWLIDHCTLVMTDSGGLQKEAYFFALPCITLRDETEWVELVEIGANTLVGVDKDKILSAYQAAQSRNTNQSYELNLYGGGMASKMIVNHLKKAF
jgi:UDP-GlcNAc3NAcA epimerase